MSEVQLTSNGINIGIDDSSIVKFVRKQPN